MTRQFFRRYHRPGTGAGRGEACGEVKKTGLGAPILRAAILKYPPWPHHFFTFLCKSTFPMIEMYRILRQDAARTQEDYEIHHRRM